MPELRHSNPRLRQYSGRKLDYLARKMSRLRPSNLRPLRHCGTIVWISVIDSAAGAALGAFFIYAVGELYFRLRHVEGMGFGDVKLMGMVGAFLGPKLTLVTIFAGAVLGTIFGLAATLAVWKKRVRRRQKRREKHIFGRSWASARLMLRYY